jgi:hypothetical protein
MFFCLFLIMWETNLGLLYDTHLLLGLNCVLLLLENMQSLLKFVQRRDIFICDFIAVVKVCQGQLYTHYIMTPRPPSALMNFNPLKDWYKVIMRKFI